MIRRPPRSTLSSSSAASDVYKRQMFDRVKLRPDQHPIEELLAGGTPAPTEADTTQIEPEPILVPDPDPDQYQTQTNPIPVPNQDQTPTEVVPKQTSRPPSSLPIAPARDYNKRANSIDREALPAGTFPGASKKIYDALYLRTRGAVTPERIIRATRREMMKLSLIHISEPTRPY